MAKDQKRPKASNMPGTWVDELDALADMVLAKWLASQADKTTDETSEEPSNRRGPNEGSERP
jgi:hypothetical protein